MIDELREYRTVPGRMPVRRLLAGVLGAAVLTLPACGSPVSGIPSAAPGSTAPPSPSATPTPTPTPQAAAPRTASPDQLDLLRSALLRPTEIGPNWQVSPDQPAPDAKASAVCGGQGVVAQFPDAQRIGTALKSDAGELTQETLSVFADDGTAGSAFDAFAAGLNCDSGTLGTAKVTLTKPQDVRQQVLGASAPDDDRATSWTLTSDAFSAVLVSVTVDDQLVNFVFLTPKGGKLTRLDALALARTGVARLLAT